jgi:hypothetical protein
MLTILRDYNEYPGRTKAFEFGIVDTYKGPRKGEIQYTGLREARMHGQCNARQERHIQLMPADALIVGYRIHSYWDDTTNGPFKIWSGVLHNDLNVMFRTQRSRGGHWGVEAWYVDKRTYALRQ